MFFLLNLACINCVGTSNPAILWWFFNWWIGFLFAPKNPVEKWTDGSGQIRIIHQPGRNWNNGTSPTKLPFGGEVVIIWPDGWFFIGILRAQIFVGSLECGLQLPPAMTGEHPFSEPLDSWTKTTTTHFWRGEITQQRSWKTLQNQMSSKKKWHEKIVFSPLKKNDETGLFNNITSPFFAQVAVGSDIDRPLPEARGYPQTESFKKS